MNLDYAQAYTLVSLIIILFVPNQSLFKLYYMYSCI